MPFNAFGKKFPKISGVIKKVGEKIFINPAIRLKEKALNLKEKLTPKIFGVWKENNYLNLLNIAYDFTPCKFIDMIITEVGMMPASSAADVLTTPVMITLSFGVLLSSLLC